MLDHDTLMLVKPRARGALIARPVGNEVVVYDPETHTAHCLNRTAAVVLRSADGESSVAAITQTLASETGTEPDEDVVWTTLERLAEAKLLQAKASRPVSASRRRALRHVGLGAAVLAPIVASLLVPTPAEAAATCIQEAACDATTIGNNCYVLAQAECATKVCTGVGVCQ
jgi:PqqD family protein of HPr-rel-A system